MTLQADFVKAEIKAHSEHRERSLWWVFGGAALLRLALIPLNHPWDAQTFYNLFVDLSQQHSPYDTFEQLSYYARSAKINPYYEYFAYPPGLIYLYYPVARLYALLDPQLAYHFGSPGTLPAFPVPLLASFLFKLPVLLADLATGWLLRKMAGLRVAIIFLFNPYALFMSSWMFDSLMVLCIVAGLYWLEQGKSGLSGLALAAGTLIKIVPVFIVPVLLVSMIARRNRQVPRFLAVYLLAVILPCLPFLSGIGFVLGFHGQRVGGGLNWQGLWYFLSTWFPTQRWDDYIYSFSGAVGALVLVLGMLLTCALVYRYRPSALATFIIALAGYLAFTKIVNEVYALPLVPLLLLQLARWASPELGGETPPLPTGRHLLKLGGENPPLPSGKTRRMALERCYKLVWSVPLAFALVNVPFFHFTLPFLGNLELVDSRNASLLSAYQPRPELSLILFLTGLFFTGLCLTIMALMLIPKKAVSY